MSINPVELNIELSAEILDILTRNIDFVKKEIRHFKVKNSSNHYTF